MKGKIRELPRGRRTVLHLVVTLAFGLLYYYFKLPAINLHDPRLYRFVILLAFVFCLLTIVSLGLHKAASQREFIDGIKQKCLPPVLIVAGLIVIYLIGSLVGAPIFRARDYRGLLDVRAGDFASEVSEASFEQIPMLDEKSAIRLGDRKMGQLADLVSQFEVSDAYTQINYRGRPVRVTYLEYGDFFKWINNQAQGLPAYITVDMVTQEASVVRLSDLGLGGIRYSPSELFFRNLERHLRLNYPTFIFDDATFEIDEDGTPWWVCPRVVKRIGLFGGTDIQGAVLVNAITGESAYYEDVPTWCDRVYLAQLIMQQYDYHGKYVNGWLNSLFGQKNVTVTTNGWNYIAMNDDVYMYTGVTSITSDQSNIGFLLSNQRTKETVFYSAPGAVEESARSSAQGVVQDLGYVATFPLLLNVAGEPTYFMSLKDAADLVKQYAMVNVAQYQLVATGPTVAACEEVYLRLLAEKGITTEETETQTEIRGVVAELRFAVLEGTTRAYIRLEGGDCFYVVSVADSEIAAVLSEGDAVALRSAAQEGELRAAFDLRRD